MEGSIFMKGPVNQFMQSVEMNGDRVEKSLVYFTATIPQCVMVADRLNRVLQTLTTQCSYGSRHYSFESVLANTSLANLSFSYPKGESI